MAQTRGMMRAAWAGQITGTGLRRVLLGVLLLVATACAPVYRNHGYVPSDQELAALEVGVDTRETVAATVGRPSASGLLNDVGWYYVQSRWKHRGGRAPVEEERQVVAITFTEQGSVANIERFGLEKGRIVPLSRRVTASNVKSAGLLKQLFGNLGRINAGSMLN